MTELLLTDVDDYIIEALNRRAMKNGLSAEEEHRRILQRHFGFEEDSVDLNRSFADHFISGPKLADDEVWIFDRNDPRNQPAPGSSDP